MLLHCAACIFLSFLSLVQTLGLLPQAPVFQPVANANHIFNAIHSSMRQWGSSLNHNGMSLFPAIIPKGTLLYHGTDAAAAVTGMEWVAFERDHALQFAHLYLAPMPWPPIYDAKTAKTGRHEKSSLWTLMKKQHIFRTQRQPHNPDTVWILPGYLRIYAAKKDLRLLYLDGSAAAKSNKGTLDVTDLLLLNDSQMITFADHDRARRLCHIAANDWGGQVEGFIRMEAGFEVIICSFAETLDLLEALKTEEIGHGGTMGWISGIFYWLRAAAARYNGIGGSPLRVQLNYDAFITAYNYPLDVFQNGSTNLPRLTTAPQEILEDMSSDLKSMVLEPDNFDQITQQSCNWQAVADMIIQKYANPLQQLVTSPDLGNSSVRLAQELHYMLRPFFNTLHRNAPMEIERCAAEFMPPNSNSSFHHDRIATLSERVIYTVSRRICSTLIDIIWSLSPSPSSLSGDDIPTHQLTSLRTLISYLAWTEWKKCKGCSWDEICSIPMFPFGVVQDHEEPRCRSMDTLEELTGYWDDTSL